MSLRVYLSSSLRASYISSGAHPLRTASVRQSSSETITTTPQRVYINDWQATLARLSFTSPWLLRLATVGPLASGPPGRVGYIQQQRARWLLNGALPALSHANAYAHRLWNNAHLSPLRRTI